MGESMRKVSFIVPCYKVEKYLARCLDSLLEQTLDDIEIICVNDGSPDNSINILRNYQERYKDKISVIDKNNEGVWRARYDGIKIAKGEYIGFVDSDDYVKKDFAEKLYNEAKKFDADISVCGFERIDMETGKIYSGEMVRTSNNNFNIKKNPEKILALNGAPWNKIYRAEILKNINDLSKPPQVLEDMMLLLLICIHAEKVVFVQDSLLNYMVHLDSAINTIKEEQREVTYKAMLEVRNIYKQENSNMLLVVDAMAFLHLGISLMFRLSYDPKCNLRRMIKTNLVFLDKYFPTWRNCKYLTISYMMKNGFENIKLWVVRWTYRLHIFGLFLAVYKFMIDRLKIDIKW